MKTPISMAAGLWLLCAPWASAVLINESGDFGGSSASPTSSTSLGSLPDHHVTLNGQIAGAPDLVDAWTFSVPAEWTLTAINVNSSGFDGNFDFIDLYTNLNANPDELPGDLLSRPLVASNHSLWIGPGTYKLTVLSTQTASYSIDIVSVPEPTTAALIGAGLIGAALLNRLRRTR